MDSLVAACRPAAALLDEPESGVIDPSNHEGVLPFFGEMTLQAQVGIGHLKHFGIHASMRLVTGRAPFTHRFMFEGKRSGLGWMAIRAGPQYGRPNACGEQVGIAVTVRIMTINAGHPVFTHRMTVGKGKFSLNLKVALETGIRGTARIMDQMAAFAHH